MLINNLLITFLIKRADAVQYEFRNYLPAIGRWMTRDPLGEAGGLNLYAFVGQNPVNWVDPWGLAPVGWIVRLTNKGVQKIAPVFSVKAAATARQQGKNILTPRKSLSEAIEIAAHGFKNLLRHKGHDLGDGKTGLPHYQTDGKFGHTFWGNLSVIGVIGSFLDPFDSIKGELDNPDDLWGNYGLNPDGTPLSQPATTCPSGEM